MGRKAAVFWHAAFSIIASLLYFGFVLPRWWELMGDTSHALGTALRIVAVRIRERDRLFGAGESAAPFVGSAFGFAGFASALLELGIRALSLGTN